MTDPSPVIISILISSAKGEPMVSNNEVAVLANKGIEEDRYLTGTGYYSGNQTWDANITLQAQEAFDEVKNKHNVDIKPEQLRRNLITKNINLKDLIGKKFRIGSAVFKCTKEWPPCRYISEQIGDTNIVKYFAHSGGVGADVLESGRMKCGDEIFILD